MVSPVRASSCAAVFLPRPVLQDDMSAIQLVRLAESVPLRSDKAQLSHGPGQTQRSMAREGCFPPEGHHDGCQRLRVAHVAEQVPRAIVDDRVGLEVQALAPGAVPEEEARPVLKETTAHKGASRPGQREEQGF